MRIHPKSTLIISTYNWPQALEITLKSVLEQVVKPNEVIIADDGSADETRGLIEKAKKTLPCPLIHVWHEDKGFRLAEIRNKAIARASGEYIIQTDGDIILEKHFVKDHLDKAEKGLFIAGSRALLDEEYSKKILLSAQTNVSIFNKHVDDRLNGMRIPFLSNYFKFRYKKKLPYYGRGCNMSFWRDDMIKTNGYDENMTGWGKEDVELIVRMINMGRRRVFLKFGGVTYHLWHPINSRENEMINDKLYERSIREKLTYAENGIDKYLIRNV